MITREVAEFKASFGAVILKKRFDMGLTQSELADRANIHRSQIVRIESGNANPTLTTILVLALALDTTPGALLNQVYNIPE